MWTFLATLKPAATGARTLTTSYVLPVGSLQAVRGQFRWAGSASPCTSGAFNDRDDVAFAVGPDLTPPTASVTAPGDGELAAGGGDGE